MWTLRAFCASLVVFHASEFGLSYVYNRRECSLECAHPRMASLLLRSVERAALRARSKCNVHNCSKTLRQNLRHCFYCVAALLFSTPYCIAMVCAVAEHYAWRGLAHWPPQNAPYPRWTASVGMLLIVLGEVLRKAAMVRRRIWAQPGSRFCALHLIV